MHECGHRCPVFLLWKNCSKNAIVLFYWKIFINHETRCTSACYKCLFINKILLWYFLLKALTVVCETMMSLLGHGNPQNAYLVKNYDLDHYIIDLWECAISSVWLYPCQIWDFISNVANKVWTLLCLAEYMCIYCQGILGQSVSWLTITTNIC